MFGIIFWVFIILILYTYAGYPMLLALMARFKPRRPDYPPAYPSVSLLIAAFNEEQILEAKIKNSLALEYPKDKLQIIVANDNSNDRTAEIAAAFSKDGVHLVSTPARMGKIGNIDYAVKASRGEILVISDATSMYDTDAIKELVAPFVDDSIGIVGGVRVVEQGDGVLSESEGLYWKYEVGIEENECRLGTCVIANGDILAIRRDLWTDIPLNIINEDFYLAMRVIKNGKRVMITPRAVGRERVSLSARDEIVRRTRMAAGVFQAMSMAFQTLPWKYPLYVWQVVSHKFMRPLLPFWMIGTFLANLGALILPASSGNYDLITLAAPYQWIFFCAQAAGYLLALIGNQRENKKSFSYLFYIPTFLVNSNLAAIKGFIRYLNHQQSNQWQRVERRSTIIDSQ